MTQLKSDFDVQEVSWQRKLTELRQIHEENMTDAVANKVVEALNAKSAKRGESMDIVAEAMLTIGDILKAKGSGHQKIARALVRGLNPNLVTRHTLRSVCHTFKDLYTLLEVSFSAALPDIGLLEKDRLSKERLADYFRVNLCRYAGESESEAEEDFCTSAFGMQLYKHVGGLRLYLTEEAAAAGVTGSDDSVPWEIDDGTADATLVPIPPSASAPIVSFSEPVVSGGLPPGWVAEERMPRSGKAYKIYRGPNGEYSESKSRAWKFPITEAIAVAAVALAPWPHTCTDPPSSPVSQRLEGEDPVITPRLQRVLSATRHSPSEVGRFTSIHQLFEPELQSPVQTRLRGACLQLTNCGAFSLQPAPVIEYAGASTPFHSHAEVEKAKQTKAIAKWRAFLKETYPPRAGVGAFMWQFEANMMGGHLAFHQVPADAREAVLQAAYRCASA